MKINEILRIASLTATAVFLVLMVNASALGQTNPTPFDLSSGNYSFTGFVSGTVTTYPDSMQGHSFSALPTSANLTAPPSADRALVVSTDPITTGSIRNEVSNGISLLNSGSNNIGAIVVALNTTGRSSITVGFTAQQLNDGNSRINGLRLQYRVGTSGNFTDVSPITEYLTAATGVNGEQTFSGIVLPSEVNNQPVVQVRWVYYEYSGSGSRDRIRLDEISITSSPAGGLPALSINDVSQIEGNVENSTFSFTVSLSSPAGPGGVTFDIATANNTASTFDDDYVGNSQTGLLIPEGEQEYTFNVTVKGDTKVEPDETFFVNVTNVTGATVSDGIGLGTIINDDFNPTVELSVSSDSGSEADSSVITVTATASSPVNGDQTVTLSVSGTAVSGLDYSLSSTTITILDGQTVGTATFTVIDDSEAEVTETATLTITAVSSGLTIGSPFSQTISIIDNDAVVCTSVLINEIYINPPSFDNGTEYVELRGLPIGGCIVPANTYFVALEGDSGVAAGTADFVVDISNQFLGTNGLLYIKSDAANAFPTPAGTTQIIDTQLNSDGIENGSVSFLVVTNANPIVEGTDYDTDNDGALEGDLASATILDSIAVTDGGAGDILYAPLLSNETSFNGGPDALSRLGGFNTPNSPTAFFYGDMAGADSSSTMYSPTARSAYFPANGMLTPGAPNTSPTSAGASISGRVTTSRGRGIGNVRVMLSGGRLEQPVYTQTSPFGYYRFQGIAAGETYVITVFSKSFNFSQPSRVFSLLDNIADADFVADER